ncbi:MAG: DUF1963 domain-containing protein [Thermoguttaceae bacterium]
MTDAEKEALKQKLMSLAKNEIVITYDDPITLLPATATRIGGVPAVPKDFEWPRHARTRIRDWLASLVRRVIPGLSAGSPRRELPLAFLGQINLKDAAPYDKDGLLPKSGVLSFFLDPLAGGSDSSDRGAARVFYFPDEAALTTVANFPDDLDDERKFPEFAPGFMCKTSLPDCDEYAFLTNDGRDWGEEYDDFEQCRSECGFVESDGFARFKLLGYPRVICDFWPDSMEGICESATAEFRGCEEEDTYEEFLERAKEWTLLLEADSISRAKGKISGFFEPAAKFNFWIRKEDLRNLNFENVWLISYCY